MLVVKWVEWTGLSSVCHCPCTSVAATLQIQSSVNGSSPSLFIRHLYHCDLAAMQHKICFCLAANGYRILYKIYFSFYFVYTYNFLSKYSSINTLVIIHKFTTYVNYVTLAEYPLGRAGIQLDQVDSTVATFLSRIKSSLVLMF